jgi:hypothetical protein
MKSASASTGLGEIRAVFHDPLKGANTMAKAKKKVAKKKVAKKVAKKKVAKKVAKKKVAKKKCCGKK